MKTYLFVHVYVFLYVYLYKCVLVLSRLVSSSLVSSCLVSSRLVLSRLVSSRLVSSCVFSVVVHGVPSQVCFEIAGTEPLYQARRMIRGLGMCSSGPIFKLKMCKIQWLLSVNFFFHMITLRVQILVIRTGDER